MSSLPFKLTSLRTRMLATSLVLLVLMGGVVGVAVTRFGQVDDVSKRITEQASPGLALLLNIDRDAYQAQLGLEQSLRATAEGDTAALEDYFGNRDQTGERFSAFEELAIGGPDELELHEQFWTARAEWVSLGDALADRIGDDGAVDGPFADDLVLARVAFEEMRTSLDLLQELVYEPALAADSAEIASTVSASRTLLLAGLALAVALGLGLAWASSRLLLPLQRNADRLGKVAEGDLSVRFDVQRDDEVGQTAQALNSALGSIGTTMVSVESSGRQVSSAAVGLTGVAQQLSAAATDTADQASSVVVSSEEIAANTTAVAAAMEEMGASITEIAQSTSAAAQMTSQAVTVVGSTRGRMEKLDESATAIGNVVGVITSIAEQTNLLALNATIEAARVGEAGKGFAVVANEVKALAQQTASATDEIRSTVEAIQSDTVGAVGAIGEIAELIDRVNEIATTIAGAVEEQSATTTQVTRSLGAVSSGAADISQNIGSVARTADATLGGARQTEEAASELDRLAEELRAALGRFVLPVTGKTSDLPVVSRTDTTSMAPAHAAPSAPTSSGGDFDQLLESVVNNTDDAVPAGWSSN